jgi:prevent-host-death family protein
MKTMPVEEFQEHCLDVMDEVQAKHESIVITKAGKPVAELIPVRQYGELLGFLKGQGTIVGDLVEPITPPEDWSDDI